MNRLIDSIVKEEYKKLSKWQKWSIGHPYLANFILFFILLSCMLAMSFAINELS